MINPFKDIIVSKFTAKYILTLTTSFATKTFAALLMCGTIFISNVNAGDVTYGDFDGTNTTTISVPTTGGLNGTTISGAGMRLVTTPNSGAIGFIRIITSFGNMFMDFNVPVVGEILAQMNDGGNTIELIVSGDHTYGLSLRDSIYANSTTTGDVTITQSGTMVRTKSSFNKAAIRASNQGNGNLLITNTGNITSVDGIGINAFHLGGTGNVVINNSGNITTTNVASEAGNAINVLNNGGGNTIITTSGVMSSGGYGIVVEHRNDAGEIEINSTMRIGDSVNFIRKAGILTTNLVNATNITQNAGLYSIGEGIDALSTTGAINISTNGEIVGSLNAVKFTSTSGDVSVNVNGSGKLISAGAAITGSTSGKVVINNKSVIYGKVNVTGSDISTSQFINSGTWSTGSTGSTFSGALNNSGTTLLESDTSFDTLNMSGGAISVGGMTVGKLTVENVNLSNGNLGTSLVIANYIGKTGGSGTVTVAAGGGATVTAMGGTINSISKNGIDVANTGAGTIDVENTGTKGVVNNTNGTGIKTRAETGTTNIEVKANVTGSTSGIDFAATSGDVTINIANGSTLMGVNAAINGTSTGKVTINNSGTITGDVSATGNANSKFTNESTAIWNVTAAGARVNSEFINDGGAINLTGNLTLNKGELGGTFTGAGNIIKTGSDVLTFKSNNWGNYSGDIELNEGTISLLAGVRIDAKNIKMADGTTLLSKPSFNDTVVSSNIILADGGIQYVNAKDSELVFSGRVEGTGTLTLLDGDLELAGAFAANLDIRKGSVVNRLADLGDKVTIGVNGTLINFSKTNSKSLNLAGEIRSLSGAPYTVEIFNQTAGSFNGGIVGNYIVRTGGIGTIIFGADGGTKTIALGGTINAFKNAGIDVANSGAQDVSVENSGIKGVVNNAAGDGIKTTAVDGNTQIKIGANVTGSGDGIHANATGTGDININGTGNIVGGSNVGDDGIEATSTSGKININVKGDISGDPGIVASSTTGDIDIVADGLVSGTTDGIKFTSTSGNVRVDVKALANVTGTNNAIFGTTTGNITLSNAGAINGTLNVTGGGVTLNNDGTINGLVNVTSNGNVNLSNSGTINGLLNIAGNAAGSSFNNTGMWNGFGGASNFSGTLNNGGTINLQNADPTDIISTGDLTLNSASVLKLDVDNNHNADKLMVSGTVTVGGELDLLASGTSGLDVYSEFLLIDNDGTADAVNGDFIKLTSNLAFLNPSIDLAAGDGNDVVLKFLPITPDFKPFAQDDNQTNAAIGLDSFDYNTDEGKKIYTQILGLTNDQAAQVLKDLTGDDHSSSQHFAGQAAENFRNIVSSHNVNSTAQSPTIGYTSSATGNAQNIVIWAQTFAELAKIDKATTVNDLSAFNSGVVMGADYKLGADWTIGATAGYTQSNFKTFTIGSTSTAQNYHVGTYVSWGAVGIDQTGLGISASADYTHSAYKTRRALNVGGINSIAAADYSGSTYGGQVKIRYGLDANIGDAKIVWAPFVGISASHTNINGFSETGAGLLNISSTASSHNQLSSMVGIEISSKTRINNADVNFHASAAWKHEFGDVNQTTTRKLQGAAASFTSSTPKAARNSVLISAGADIATSDNLTLTFAAFGEFSRTSQNYGVSVGLTFKF